MSSCVKWKTRNMISSSRSDSPRTSKRRGRRASEANHRLDTPRDPEVRRARRKRAGRTVLSELAAYVPDLHPDDDFDEAGSNEERER